MDLLLRAGPARERQLRVGQALQVGAVLAQDRRRARAVDRRAVARARRASACSTSGSSRSASRGRPSREPPSREHRDLDRREVVAARRARAPTGSRSPCRRRCGRRPGAARARASPISSWPGTGSACGARQRQRRAGARRSARRRTSRSSRCARARLVASAAPRSSRAHARAAPPGTRSGRAGGPSRRAWRAARRRAKPACSASAGSELELVRAAPASRCRTPRSPRAHERAGRLPDARGDDEDVGVEPDGPHARLGGAEQLGRLEQRLDLGRRLLLAARASPCCG